VTVVGEVEVLVLEMEGVMEVVDVVDEVVAMVDVGVDAEVVVVVDELQDANTTEITMMKISPIQNPPFFMQDLLSNF